MRTRIAIALPVLMIFSGWAQTNSAAASNSGSAEGVTNFLSGGVEITFNEFLSEVATANLDYAAQRYNVSIADAAISAAREFQNPILQLNGQRDVTHAGSQRMPDVAGASLTQTIELGGKRKYRILGARQARVAASKTLEDFLRNLKADAAEAFADALSQSRNAEQKGQSAAYLTRLANTQRDRFKAGSISQADMLQTQVEEQQFQNELLAAQADAESASILLSSFLGRERSQTLLVAKGNLEVPPREYETSRLIADTLRQRPDLVALRNSLKAAESKFHQERANRIPNVDVGVDWSHSSSSQNSISPSPEFDSAGLSFSFALPIWNRNRAAITSARLSAEQAEKQLEAAELKAEVQIRQAITRYRSTVGRVRHYQSGILRNADAVLEAKRFSYQRGQTTLLELLDAQRTANEIRSGYNDALADQAKALVELQRAAGLWEIQF